jgi:hypothetical protein
LINHLLCVDDIVSGTKLAAPKMLFMFTTHILLGDLEQHDTLISLWSMLGFPLKSGVRDAYQAARVHYAELRVRLTATKVEVSKVSSVNVE